MDLSDGLGRRPAADLQASNVSAEVELDALPVRGM